MTSLLLQNETISFIKGPVGLLELAICQHENTQHNERVAIVCHPHPLYGGTMSNKVVTTLIKTYQALHFTTMRFNFRGVSQSEGHYSDGVGELDDLLSVIHYAHTKFPHAALYLAGFSFGAYIAIKAIKEANIKHLVTVAPPVENFPMAAENPTCPWILVQGDQDEIVKPEAVYDFAQSRKMPPTILRFPNATHFFHGQLKELQERLQEVIF